MEIEIEIDDMITHWTENLKAVKDLVHVHAHHLDQKPMEVDNTRIERVQITIGIVTTNMVPLMAHPPFLQLHQHTTIDTYMQRGRERERERD